MNHQQRTALQRYAATYRAGRRCPFTRAIADIEEAACLAAGCTTEQCAEIRRGIDLALALDAYAAARRALGAKPRAATATACIEAESKVLDAGGTLEQCAEIRDSLAKAGTGGGQ